MSDNSWKYGLKLVVCPSCIDERRIPFNCKTCNDMGELWETRVGKTIIVGELHRFLSNSLSEQDFGPYAAGA